MNIWDNEHVIDLLEEYAQIHGLKYERNTPYRNCPSSFIKIFVGNRVKKVIHQSYPDKPDWGTDVYETIEGNYGTLTWCNSWAEGIHPSTAKSDAARAHVYAMNKIIETNRCSTKIDGQWVFKGV